MSTSVRRKPATYEDLLAVPDNKVAEILDGELFASPRPAFPHAHASSTLGGEISTRFHGLALGDVVFENAALRVRTLAVPQLLAMKLTAWRDDLDIADARLLLSKLPGEKDGVWRQMESYLVPGRELKARYAFEDLWEASHGSL